MHKFDIIRSSFGYDASVVSHQCASVSVGRLVFHCGELSRVVSPKYHTAEKMSKRQDPKELSAQSTPPVSHTQLPKELQKLVDDDDSLIDQIYDGT